MKKYIYLIIAVLFISILLGFGVQYDKASKYKSLYEKELQNIKAYQAANSGLEEEIKEYKMSLSDLYDSKDSLDKKLVATMQELKLTNNKIKEMQYMIKQANKIDTIVIPDTVFIPNVDIDTIIGDKWYNINLKLKYPSTIITSPTFNSEQYIYIYNTKNYVGGKSKWFFINWFKKKYISTEVKVEEKNPNIKLLNQKFIQIDGN